MQTVRAVHAVVRVRQVAMSSRFVPSDRVSQIRRRLAHPIIDADGHLVEFMPMVIDCMREVAGDAVAERFIQYRRSPFTSGGGYLPTRVFFGNPLGLDRMTVLLPKLFYRRLEEIGIDFALALPDLGALRLEQPRRRASPGGRPGAEHVLRPSLCRLPRPSRARRRHPHVHPRRGGGRARLRRRRARASRRWS